MGLAKTVTAAMALAGAVGGVGSYLLLFKLFALVFYLLAGALSLVPIAVAYAILARRRRFGIHLSWGRALWVIFTVLIGYPVCMSVLERLHSVVELWFPAVPGDLRVVLAMIVAGLFAAGVAWSATCVFTASVNVQLLYLFAAASTVTAIAGSLASSCAARYLATGPLILSFLLYPGVLYLVGMSLFGAVFGYGLATSGGLDARQRARGATIGM